MNLLVHTIVLAVCLGPTDPGTVAVKDGDLAVVTVDLPASTAYELDYPFASRSYAWFDRARTNLAFPFQVYMPRAKGDMNGDHLLDGRDIPGFVSTLLNGPYNARADFDDDNAVSASDVPGFVEALVGGYPAEGIVLYVEARHASTALGDAAIDILTDPTGTNNFTVHATRLMTTVEFYMPTSGLVGTAATFRILPGIAPLGFSASTTARWEGEILVDNGTGPSVAVDYAAADVQEISAGTAEIIVGSGSMPPVPVDTVIAHATGTINGRMAFNLDNRQITTPTFAFGLSPLQARFNHLQFDPHDPGGYAPTYGATFAGVPVLHVTVPADPQLDTYWFYQVALDVPVEENAYTTVNAPPTITVDVRTYDGGGLPLDSFAGITLTRIDSDNNPAFISYRSDLVRPFIFVDAAVNKAAFPGLRIVQTADTGSLVVLRR